MDTLDFKYVLDHKYMGIPVKKRDMNAMHDFIKLILLIAGAQVIYSIVARSY